MKIAKAPHERDFYALKMFSPDDNQVIVDVGSNRGEAMQSMLVVSKFKNTIIGFEPNPLVFNKLKSYFSSNNRVKVHNFGLGDKNEDLELYVPFYRKWMFDGLASFHYNEAKDWLENRLWGFDEKKLTIKKVSCKVRKLDDYNLNPYFIKIDVQGFEFEVLKGAEKTIAAHNPIILVESISDEIIDFLKKYDYDFYFFEDGKFSKGKGVLNTYCVTQEKYEKITP